jgi:hypothetical protein
MNGTSLKLDDASFDEVFADLLKPQEGSEFNDDSYGSDGSLMKDILGYLSIKGISLGDLLREISRYLKEQTK